MLCLFVLLTPSRKHKQFKLVGSGAPLGNWKIAHAVELQSYASKSTKSIYTVDGEEGKYDPFEFWFTFVEFPEDQTSVEYKFVGFDGGSGFTWEGAGSGHNRKLDISSCSRLTDDYLTNHFDGFTPPSHSSPIVIAPVVHWNDIMHVGTESQHTSQFAHELSHKNAFYATKLTENIWIGSCPRKKIHVQLLQDRGITAVVNLQELVDIVNNCSKVVDTSSVNDVTDHLEHLYTKHNISFVFLPTKDMVQSTKRMMMSTAALVLQQLISNKHVVYVHCNCGIGRAIAAAASYLVNIKKFEPEIAALYITSCRPVAYFDMIALNSVSQDFKRKFG